MIDQDLPLSISWINTVQVQHQGLFPASVQPENTLIWAFKNSSQHSCGTQHAANFFPLIINLRMARF